MDEREKKQYYFKTPLKIKKIASMLSCDLHE